MAAEGSGQSALQPLRFTVLGLGFRVSGFGFGVGVWGLGFGVGVLCLLWRAGSKLLSLCCVLRPEASPMQGSVLGFRV